MVTCLQCGRTWADDKKGRNNLAKHKSRNTALDGTMLCKKREEKKRANQQIAELNTKDISTMFDMVNKNEELKVQLKLKIEENEKLKSNSFQPCKISQSIFARRSMTEPDRRLILEKQGNQCAGIDCKLSSMSGHPYDIDHKVPIQFGGTDESNNLQALCTECHRKKTDFERTLKTVLENGGSQTVVFPDSWPHFITNGIYSKQITHPIVIYTRVD